MDAPAPALVVSATRATWLATHGNHPNLVRVLGVHHVATGPRLMLEQVPGRDLAALIDAAFPERLDLAIVLAIARDCARGLHYLHELRDQRGTAVRLVHAGLAPALITVGFDGTARVAGLELLCATRGRPPPDPRYAAPEQGIAGEAVDRRADVFALAAVILRAACGLALRDGAMPVPTSQAVPYVPQSVEDVLRRALAREPARRPGSAEELRAALEGCVVREGLGATPDQVALAVSRLLPDLPPPAAPLPPRPDQSLWAGGRPAGAPAWMPVESVVETREPTSASGFDVISVVVPRRTLPPTGAPAVPTAAPAAPTLAVAPLDEATAIAPVPVAPRSSPPPEPIAPMPIAPMPPEPAFAYPPVPPAPPEPAFAYPPVAGLLPVALPPPPPPRRLFTDPLFLVGGGLVLFFAALVIAYLAAG